MKELGRGIVTSILSLLVFTPLIIIGIIYNIYYPWVMGVQEKSWTLPFKIYWRLIDGTAATLGNMLYDGIGIQWDKMGNVWGEWIEDSIVVSEHTKFGEKDITISATIGHIEHHDLFMYKRGKILSRILNVVFGEKQHALGSWLKYLAIQDVIAQDLKGKK